MTRFIHNEDLALPGTKKFQLEIVKIGQEYAWSYSSKRVITKRFAIPVEIELKNKTGDEAAITNYASTGVAAPHFPISAWKLSADAQSASFTINLQPNQLIDFGVFVAIEQNDGSSVILFCDPQASNDPIKTR